MNSIERHIEIARKKLLDLTMRNRLLNFRPSKNNSLRIIDEIPAQVFQILVVDEKKMAFLPTKETSKERTENGESLLTAEEASIAWKMPSTFATVDKRHQDRNLQTSLESEQLQKRLFKIYQQSRSFLEEQGYSPLYLVLGFLQWKESEQTITSRKAPLILIPVEINRTEIGKAFKISYSEEEIATNISLREKLTEQNINLPEVVEINDNLDVDNYFANVKKAIKSKEGWEVDADIYLGFFSFKKYVMYKDLDANAWPEEMIPANRPLIKSIFGEPDEGFEGQSAETFDEEDCDEKLAVKDLYHVMDADSSQIAVIEEAKAHKNLAVEGPPGTGKSQTIANIIAELLARDKTILFVSEKMAALEVVKKRLDYIGLGDFCLELYSQKANKKQVLAELERTINIPPAASIQLDEQFDKLEKIRKDLNLYVKAIREPIGQRAISPFQLISEYEKMQSFFARRKKAKIPQIEISNVESITTEMWNEIELSLINLKGITQTIGSVSAHPFFGWNNLLNDKQPLTKETLKEIVRVSRYLLKLIGELQDICPISCSESSEGIKCLISSAEFISNSSPITKAQLLSKDWQASTKEMLSILQLVESFQMQEEICLKLFDGRAFYKEVAKISDEYQVLSTKIFKLLTLRYRRLRREILDLYKNKDEGEKKNNEGLLDDLAKLDQCIKTRSRIRQQKEKAAVLFGEYWQQEKSETQKLKKTIDEITNFRVLYEKGVLNENSAAVFESLDKKNLLKSSVTRVIDAFSAMCEQMNKLEKLVSPSWKTILKQELQDVDIILIANKCEFWESSLSLFSRWSQYLKYRADVMNTPAGALIELVENQSLGPDELMECFTISYCNLLLEKALSERQVLANFVGAIHENKIAEFIKLDKELLVKNRQRLSHLLCKKRPQLVVGGSKNSEVGVLLGEINRKRKHVPIRKLLKFSGRLIKRFKPCFMMSPLSIAQFLDPRNSQGIFDVIIFDEASQVRPEDGLGALLRGNQAIVMGDTKQLPPTSFFDHMLESDEDEENAEILSIGDIESILHQSKRNFLSKTLRWHYRSRHESLIAVSNHQFYDNKLYVYPSSIDKAEMLGLEIRKIESIYDRGKSRANRVEARAVVEAVFEQLRSYPEKSLGVGTFNASQQQAILEELEYQRKMNPELEGYFLQEKYEHFFVKNLETIQGDERDVIFISVGYGFDSERRLTKNFGPLNKDGGERRLNVLISRARERCVVFCNFTADDLYLEESSSFGLRALKVFLDYAERRELSCFSDTDGEFDSPFEEGVHDFLRDSGYVVKKQVGCAGFRIDLGVLDPLIPGRYLMGIECDGAQYHSSLVARDRDRLRQKILENLGWELHRVWSTDWYRNRSETEKGLLDALERAKNSRLFSKKNRDKEKIKDIILREEIAPKVSASSIEEKIPIYKCCSGINDPLPWGIELHETPVKMLAEQVVEVVNIESPVHFEEVVKRIRSHWGLKRSGQRINSAVLKAANHAAREGKILIEGSFLWNAIDKRVTVRKRDGEIQPKIEYISDAEIEEAIKMVLEFQFDTKLEDLIIKSSRLFGFQATSSDVAKKLESVIHKLVRKGVLKLSSDEMLYFSSQ